MASFTPWGEGQGEGQGRVRLCGTAAFVSATAKIGPSVRARIRPSPQPSPHREERWGEGGARSGAVRRPRCGCHGQFLVVVPHGDRHHGELYAYTGAGIDAETNGLYDLRARMYSPVLGRFLQADPIGTQAG